MLYFNQTPFLPREGWGVGTRLTHTNLEAPMLIVVLLPSSTHVKAAGSEDEPSMRDTTASNSWAHQTHGWVVGLKLMYWYQDWVWD